jgi:hypothetical protein
MGSSELMADENLWTTCYVMEEGQCCTGVGGCKCDSRDSCRLQMVLTVVLSKGLKILDICVCLVPGNLMGSYPLNFHEYDDECQRSVYL